MSNSILNLFKRQKSTEQETNDDVQIISISEFEKNFENDELVEAARVFKQLLEIYGTQKRKNHRLKGREFVHFILSNKHKDLKNTGYKHYQNINKIIHLNQKKPYPYHKNNLRKAMDFYLKEVKSLKLINKQISK